MVFDVRFLLPQVVDRYGGALSNISDGDNSSNARITTCNEHSATFETPNSGIGLFAAVWGIFKADLEDRLGLWKEGEVAEAVGTCQWMDELCFVSFMTPGGDGR